MRYKSHIKTIISKPTKKFFHALGAALRNRASCTDLPSSRCSPLLQPPPPALQTRIEITTTARISAMMYNSLTDFAVLKKLNAAPDPG